MEDNKFLYSINPRRVIKNVAGIPAIRTARSLFLEKDEVLACVKCGTVYRRFSADVIVKVTPATLDRLHRDTFLTEKEYEKLIEDNKGKDRGTTKVPTVDNREAKANEKTVQGSATLVNSKEASTEKTVDSVSKTADQEEQIHTTTKPVDEKADDPSTDDTENSAVVNNEVSVPSNTESEVDVTSAQVQIDQDADDNTNKFQQNSIQINTSKKKNRGKNKH